ncbi:WD40 domain-containing protein [Rhizoctonia solani AG-1 IA]|uniref:WD40 domain-containing protein n=1 Tax=Thanatephorus cucumeris (strain AG1-IA) TaxID=983506 RepID=L8WHN0_THACA|nr:WD40 domain-containing protein [Rhizoctonia solani AG-1 IA]
MYMVILHSQEITSIRFSPLGDKLVTGSHDRCLYIWDAENGYSSPCLLGTHDDHVSSAAFSPDGTQVASCSQRGVKMWNALHSTSAHTSRLNTPTEGVCSIAISPDGSRIAAAGFDKVIYMFNAHDGTPILEPLVAHTNTIFSVAFSPNGRYLVSGGLVGICLWDATSGKLLSGPLRAYEGWIRSISFSPDSRHVVSASQDKSLRMWEVDDGTLTPTDLVGRHEDWVNSATFSPDGKRVVSGCRDGKIRMWGSKTLSLVFDPFGSQEHTGGINSVTFSFDGRLVASGSSDGTICIFDSHSGGLVLGPLKAHRTSVQSVVFSPDSYYVVSGSVDGSVRVWRVSDGAPACEPLEGHQDWVDSVVYSSDGAYIVSGSRDSTIRVWKAPETGATPGPSKLDPLTADLRESHRAIAGGLTIDDDGWARNRDSQLLFWVPSDLLKLFPRLESVYTIGPEGILHTDYNQPLLLGEECATLCEYPVSECCGDLTCSLYDLIQTKHKRQAYNGKNLPRASTMKLTEVKQWMLTSVLCDVGSCTSSVNRVSGLELMEVEMICICMAQSIDCLQSQMLSASAIIGDAYGSAGHAGLYRSLDS